MTSTTTRSCPPAGHRINVFTDGGSVCHVLFGWVAGHGSGTEALAIFALYAGYQVSQAGAGDEPLYRVGGELIEFALGMLFALLMKGE